MSKDFTPAGIINQVNEVKKRVSTLDSNGRVLYEIWGFNPAASSEYQLYAKGNNKTEKCSARFDNELDTLLSSPAIAQIKVTLKDGRKDLGSSEIIIRPAYQTATPTLFPLQVEKQPEVAQVQMPTATAQPQSNTNGVNFIQMLGQAFLGVTGLGGVTDEMGGLGTIMAIQEKVIGDKYEKQRQDDRLQGMIEENAVLKNNNENLQKEIGRLNGEIDEYEDTIGDLEEKLAEYEKLNPKRDMFSGLAGHILENSLLGIVSKTKYAGLLGLGETSSDTIPATTPIQPTQSVQIAEVDESPRGKAKQQITEWIDMLGDSDFSALYQLLTAFAKGSSITSCLNWVINGAQQVPPTIQLDDDNESENDNE